MKATLLPFLFFLNGILLLLSGIHLIWASGVENHIAQSASKSQGLEVISTFNFSPMDSLCSGSLGENIFEDGDFGSGTANVLLPDPKLAPGYLYRPSPPPNDGFYTITNNTSDWGAFAGPNWIDIQDNSNNPNGYMMVVNASFEPSIFYENTIDGLCENTLYEFSADVINVVEPTIGNHIFPNVSFLLNDEEKFTTGSITQDAKWRTYGFSFVTGPTDTSLKLTLRNNAPGGNGNDLALDNITFRACGPQVNINTTGTLCEDDSVFISASIIGDLYETPFYQWQVSSDDGISWTDIPGSTGDTYLLTDPRDRNRYRFFMSNSESGLANTKCRVVSTVETLRVVRKFNESRDTVCEGLSFSIGNSVYDESGVFIDSLISPEGCDSIVTTFLTVLDDTNIDAVLVGTNPFCPGDPSGSISVTDLSGGYGNIQFSLNDGPFISNPIFGNLSAGDYTVRFVDAIGCDFETSITLVDPPELLLSLPEDITIQLGDSIFLDPVVNQPILNAQWEPTGVLRCDTCLRQFFQPLTSVDLTLTVSNSGSCEATDDLSILVKKSRNVFIPNAFSPNLDGINDNFIIYTGLGVERVRRLNIYDRWGALLFSSDDALDIREGWNGQFNGRELNSAVYVYIAEVEFIDGEVILYRGDVALIK